MRVTHRLARLRVSFLAFLAAVAALPRTDYHRGSDQDDDLRELHDVSWQILWPLVTITVGKFCANIFIRVAGSRLTCRIQRLLFVAMFVSLSTQFFGTGWLDPALLPLRGAQRLDLTNMAKRAESRICSCREAGPTGSGLVKSGMYRVNTPLWCFPRRSS